MLNLVDTGTRFEPSFVGRSAKAPLLLRSQRRTTKPIDRLATGEGICSEPRIQLATLMFSGNVARPRGDVESSAGVFSTAKISGGRNAVSVTRHRDRCVAGAD